MNLAAIRSCIAERRYEWRKHTLIRLAERQITQKDVLSAISGGEVIEDYPDDKPFPSALIFGSVGKNPYHVVVSLDERGNWAYIITAYIPSRDRFGDDLKTRVR